MVFKVFAPFSLLLSSLCLANHYPPLPEPVTNNAVTQVSTPNGKVLLSFMGLGQGKDWQDVHNKVWALYPGAEKWQAKTPVPSSLPLKGRLASIAVSIGQTAYLFGGYTVDKDHSEVSSPDNFAYDVTTDQYQPIAPMPVATDDAVALVYQQRYIYLISGWHNDGNVNLVQIYDTQTDLWQQGSPFPGQPVFGHAGGMIDGKMLICDGVKVAYHQNSRRDFTSEAACYRGHINPENPAKIDWYTVPHPTGLSRYRMAAAGTNSGQPGVYFFGGSTNPYNYNGIGYNQVPSVPESGLWFYSFAKQQWQVQTTKNTSMDHRGLLLINNETALVIGGMDNHQQVLPKVRRVNLTIPSAKNKISRTFH